MPNVAAVRKRNEVRYKPYATEECPGSWWSSKNPIDEQRNSRGEYSHTARVICDKCGRKVQVSRRGTMHRHEKLSDRARQKQHQRDEELAAAWDAGRAATAGEQNPYRKP
jgi:hypothetical protein